MVLRMTPAMMKPKKMTPRMSGTTSRQLRMIQLVLSTVAATAMHTPSVTKKAILVVRLMGRMMGRGQDSTGQALSALAVGCQALCFSCSVLLPDTARSAARGAPRSR